MFKILKLSCFLTVFIAITQGKLSSQNLNLVWSRVEYGDNLGATNIYSADLDGDGKEEMIFGGNGYASRHVFVEEYDGNSLVNKWVSRAHFPDMVSLILLANPDNDADTELYVLSMTGILEVYDGATKMLIDTFQTNFSVANNGSIGDFDKDGNLELVMGSEYRIALYDLDTRNMVWSKDISASNINTGEVDGNIGDEIVFVSTTWNGSNGYVLDNQTGEVKWNYLGGFGFNLGLADTNQDSILEIIGVGSESIIYFDAQHHTPLSQIPVTAGTESLLVTDIENDGHPELITGDNQWGFIRCYNVETKQILWEKQNPDHGVTNIALGDPDNDGEKECIWGAGASSSGADRLYFYDVSGSVIEYQSVDLDGPFFIDAINIGNDKHLEYTIGAAQSNSNYDGGYLLGYDAMPSKIKWTLPLGNENLTLLKTTQMRSPEQHELIIGGSVLKIIDIETNALLFTSDISSPRMLAVGDINNDNKEDIVASDYTGKISIISNNGNEFENTWNSISFGLITDLILANVDNDPALEIVFSQSNGILNVYDGVTKYLQWQINIDNSDHVIAVGDLAADGTPDVVVCNSENMYIYDAMTQQLIQQQINISPDKILAVEIANIDSTLQKEIIIYDSRLKILNPSTFETVWQSDFINEDYSPGVSLTVKDLNNDQRLDFLLGTGSGTYHFSTEKTIPDIVPPYITEHLPVKDAHFQATNSRIRITFSEKMDTSIFVYPNIKITDSQGNEMGFSTVFDTATFVLTCTPLAFLPTDDTITVTLSRSIRDWSNNKLDGNRNGISEDTLWDDYVWKFKTGFGIDSIGGKIIQVSAAPTATWPGIPIKLTAILSDTSSIAQSGIAGGEYFLNQKGVSGTGQPLSPLDGDWGNVEEEAFAILLTDSLQGDIVVYVHCIDNNGNWGDWAQVAVSIYAESDANWPMFGQNTLHTNYNKDCSLELPLKVKYSKVFPESTLSYITYANGNILVPVKYNALNTSKLICLDTVVGMQKWSHDFGSIFSVNPASYAYGRAYIQTCNNSAGTYISSFDLNTGALVWQSPFDAQWGSYLHPTISDGKIYFNGGTYGGLYAFDAIDGENIWFKSLYQADRWSPAIYKNTVYVFVGGLLQAINKETGTEIWTKDISDVTGPYEVATVVVDTANKQIFVATQWHFIAVNMESHDINWQKNGYFSQISPAIYGRNLFLVENNTLRLYDATNGSPIWAFIGDSQISTSPVVTGNIVFTASKDNLFALDIQTGQQQWEFQSGGTLALGDDLLFLTGENGKLTVFEHGLTSGANDVTSVKEDFQIFPNPSTGETNFKILLPKTSKVSIEIRDVSGELAHLVPQQIMNEGYHTVNISTALLPVGVYFCMLFTEASILQQKLVVVK